MELEFTTSAEFMMKETYDYFTNWIKDTVDGKWLSFDNAASAYKLAEELKRLMSVLYERCETENEKRIADYFYSEACDLVIYWKKAATEKLNDYFI